MHADVHIIATQILLSLTPLHSSLGHLKCPEYRDGLISASLLHTVAEGVREENKNTVI